MNHWLYKSDLLQPCFAQELFWAITNYASTAGNLLTLTSCCKVVWSEQGERTIEVNHWRVHSSDSQTQVFPNHFKTNTQNHVCWRLPTQLNRYCCMKTKCPHEPPVRWTLGITNPPVGFTKPSQWVMRPSWF